MLRRLFTIAVSRLIPLACLLLLGACADGRKASRALAWPEPPLSPRILAEGSIARPDDLQREVGVLEAVGGALGVLAPGQRRGIAHPADVEVTPDGRRVYVSDFAQGLVHVFDLETGQAHYLGEERRLERPFGIAVDAAGNVYVAEQAARRIRVLSPEGETLRMLESPSLVRPIDIALDEARSRLYVADGARQHSSEHFVRVLDLEGNDLFRIGLGRGNAPGELLFPTYLAVAPDGRLFVSDTMNARISVFDPDGAFVRTIGARGDGWGLFDKPKGVAFDSFGNLYVVDSSWSIVQIFGPQDDALLYFGGRGSHAGLLRNPTAIAIAHASGENRIFVADYLNRRLSIYRLVNTAPGDGVASPSEAPS